MVCCFLAKLVLGPPHYHGTFQTCQTWRVGVCMLARYARATRRTHSHLTRVERCVFGSMVCCFLAKLVLGPPHYHDTIQTCQTWRVGVCMLARYARAKSHADSPDTSRDALVVCVWEYGVLFFGQVGTWSTTLPWHLSNVPDVASGRMFSGDMCTCQ